MVPTQIDRPQQDLATCLDTLAQLFPERDALVATAAAGTRLTYAALAAAASGLGTRFRELGFEPGQRVALLADSGPEWVVALFAAWRAGATVVPLDPKAGASELASLLATADARHLVAGCDHVGLAGQVASELPLVALEAELALPSEINHAPALTPRGEEPALIVFTSGTTGHPRGVVVPARALEFQVNALALATGYEGDERILSVLGLTHLFELVGGLLAPLAMGGTIVFAAGLLPNELCELVTRERITRVCVVPALLRLLQGCAAADPSALAAIGASLRSFVCGGAPLAPALEVWWRERGVETLVGYGMSECSPVISVNRPGATRLGSVGQALPGVELRLGDGEVLTRGPQLMSGYLGDPEATAEAVDSDGWLHTGDLGSIDPDGYLHLTGRSKDLIVLASGKKVQPAEVEERLAPSPLWREAAVVGVRDARAEERLVAVLVPAGELELEEARSAVARCCAELAPWKRPVHVVLRAAPLPRTSTLKLRRAHLRDELAKRKN